STWRRTFWPSTSGNVCAATASPWRRCVGPASLADMTYTNQFPRQTLSYLRQLFEERGIHPKNKLGQNFLIDLNLIDLIARSAELTREDIVLEVGSGTGSLT